MSPAHVLVQKHGYEINESHEEQNEDRAANVEFEERIRFAQKRDLPAPLPKRQEERIDVLPSAPLSGRKGGRIFDKCNLYAALQENPKGYTTHSHLLRGI